MGTHPSGPSKTIESDGTRTLLKDYLAVSLWEGGRRQSGQPCGVRQIWHRRDLNHTRGKCIHSGLSCPYSRRTIPRPKALLQSVLLVTFPSCSRCCPSARPSLYRYDTRSASQAHVRGHQNCEVVGEITTLFWNIDSKIFPGAPRQGSGSTPARLQPQGVQRYEP